MPAPVAVLCGTGNGSFVLTRAAQSRMELGMFEYHATPQQAEDDTPAPCPPPDPWEPILEITDDPANDGTQHRQAVR